MRSQRGHALIDALVAFVIVALSALAASRMHTTLSRSADTARQRSEAIRLAQQQIERLRAFTTLQGPHPRSYAGIVFHEQETAAANATYRIERHVEQPTDARYKAVQMRIAWHDRAGQAQHLTIPTMVAGIEPTLSGYLALPAAPGRIEHPQKRHPGIPPRATDLGDGRSSLQLPGAAFVYVVFDNVSGDIVARCTGTAPSAPEGLCEGQIRARYLGGYIRFAAPGIPATQEALREAPAKDLDVALDLHGTDPLPTSVECHDDAADAAAAGGSHAAYGCIIDLGDSTGWSGRSTVIPRGAHWGPLPPALSASADRFRLCRYSADADGDGDISNPEHPAVYTGVGASLSNQNFLVLPGMMSCPLEGPPTDASWAGNTLPHDPPDTG